MNIQPTYVTFEQAKKLKEKGFDLRCSFYYDDHEKIGWQMLFANYNKSNHLISAPEQWQVVEWINKKANIFIYVEPIPYSENLTHWRWLYKSSEYSSRAYRREDRNDYMSPKEAYSAAFDYVLDNLI